MTKIALSTNQAGTGSITIAAPNTNIDRTFTLPDAAGTAMLTDTRATTAQLPAGSVLQVVHATASEGVTSSSSTPADLTGMSVTITPTNSSSKMLVMYSFHIYVAGANSGWAGGASRVLRDSTVVFSDDDGPSSTTYGIAHFMQSTTQRLMDNAQYSFIDDHNSSSSIVYKVQGWRSQSTGQNVYFNFYGAPGRIIVMEIAA